MRMRLLPLLCCLAAAAPASAQDAPTVFVHGLSADASTWTDTARRLQGRLAIEPFVPTLPWTEPYDNQAARLQGALGGLPPNAVAVGHSNGGVVSREWSKSRDLAGIVSVGTPHLGAPLVANALSLVGFNDALYAYASIAWSAFGGGGFDPVFVYVQSALMLAGNISTGTIGAVTALLGVQATLPVAYQMHPGSAYLASLNSGANLAREAGAVRARVGLTYTARNYWMMGPARAVRPDAADALYRDMWLAIGSLELAGQYLQAAYPTNARALAIAGNLLRVASTLRGVDSWWCWAVTNDWSCATPHDGIVPVWSQAYPGGVSIALSGPAHVQEARQSDEALVQALASRVGVRARGTGGGGDFPAANSSTSLDPDEALRAGERLISNDGRFQLEYQYDGNLVLYRMTDGAALWHTGTGGSPGQLLMQLDGNLVLYAASDAPIWATGTTDYPGARLELQNDGNLVVYSHNGAPLWASGTAQ